MNVSTIKSNINNTLPINNINIIKTKTSLIEDIKKEEIIDLLGTLTINNINLNNKPIYSISSQKNNINQNITILNNSILPDQDNSIIFLAAHSGLGSLAYFKNLYKLKIHDRIIFNYQNKDYIYEITSIYEEKKNGYITINKSNNKELVLTTCSNSDDKQLIVQSILTN